LRGAFLTAGVGAVKCPPAAAAMAE